MEVNWCSPSAAPAWRWKCRNRFSKDRPVVSTPTKSAPYGGRGVRLKCRKPCSKGTGYYASTRCGTFGRANVARNFSKNYVDTWLKLKTEASGYPRWAETEEQKQRYREQYQAREDIVLNSQRIEKNPGRKATAKLMLNSFWGKFGENLRKTSTQTVTTPAHLYALVSDPTLDVTNVRICTDEVLEVCYQKNDDETVENGRTNIFIACFTTCYARLKLYSYLKRLGQQVLYFDTDSVIYSHVGDEPCLENGDFLSDLTDELEPGQTIADFTSGGPKNYGYRTLADKTECKVRGFSLHNLRGSAQLNYDVLRANVLEELTDPLEDDARRNVAVTNPHFFTRDAATKQLRVVPRDKQYGLVFDKRVVDTVTFQSYPYGYF